MRALLLIPALIAVTVRSEDATAPTMRQKLHAKILESAPPPASPVPSTDQTAEVDAIPAVVMKPIVVSESKLMREVTAALDREKQNRQEERFAPLAGGKIANVGPMQLGGWFVPGEGWTFLRLNKPPSPRQTEAAEAQLRDLQEFADLAGGRKPTPRPNATKFPSWRRTTTDH